MIMIIIIIIIIICKWEIHEMKHYIDARLISALVFPITFVCNPAFAESDIQDRLSAMEQRIQYLESRVSTQDKLIVEKDREISSLKGGESGNWYDNVEITGAVELEAASSRPYTGPGTSDAVVATAAIGIVADLGSGASVETSLLYEEDEEGVDVDTASFAIELPGDSGAITGGQYYVPFGVYESNMISSPLTLEIGETRETALQYGVDGDISVAVYAFNGSNKEEGDDQFDNFGAFFGYSTESENRSSSIGISYINDIGDSDGLQDALEGTVENEVENHVAGWGVSATAGLGPIGVVLEYVSAAEEFKADEIRFRDAGAKPESWNLEAGYSFDLAGKEATAGIAWQRTDQALALELPEDRYLVALSVGIHENIGLAIEWAHDLDYDIADGGTGESANAITGQIAIEF